MSSTYLHRMAGILPWVRGRVFGSRVMTEPGGPAALAEAAAIVRAGMADALHGRDPAASHAVVLPNGLTAVSLLGHPLRLVTADGTVYEWQAHPDGHAAHCPTASNRRGLGSPAEPEWWSVWYGRPALPDPQDGTVYIVPLVTALLSGPARRDDLVVPYGQRRTDGGQLLVSECTGLAYTYKPLEPLPGRGAGAVRPDR